MASPSVVIGGTKATLAAAAQDGRRNPKELEAEAECRVGE